MMSRLIKRGRRNQLFSASCRHILGSRASVCLLLAWEDQSFVMRVCHLLLPFLQLFLQSVTSCSKEFQFVWFRAGLLTMPPPHLLLCLLAFGLGVS